MKSKRQLAAIMFTDIVGYTALMGKDEVRALALLKRNIQIQRPLIESFHGDLLKEMGDGVLASFPTVSDAVYCAGAIQNACEAEEHPPLRIGIHLGEVVFEGNDVFGDGVNIASRIEALAPDGEIWVSESVHKNVLNKKGVETSFVREAQLKNVSEPVRIYTVKVERIETGTALINPPRYSKTNPRKVLAVAIGILTVLALSYMGINYFRGTPEMEEGDIEKSIAVLPFKNSSTNEENQHFCDGMMEGILNNLAKIGDLTVISRTSVEQYRDDPPSTFERAKQLDVNYILEGSVLRFGDQAQITAQLIYAPDDKHIWSDQYERELKVEDLFGILNEITDTIAGKLQATISPEVKIRLKAVPTTNLTAYDFYQRGREEYVKYRFARDNRDALERAEDLYHEALEYDSAFALAYTGLAEVYFNKHHWETFFTENFMDSMLILADIALSYDDQLAEAYVIRGEYYRLNDQKEQAINEYDKAIKFNPNDGQAYWGKALLFNQDDLVKIIDNFQKATALDRGPSLPRGYRALSRGYAMAGFKEKAYYYVKEALKLDNDSAAYYRALVMPEDQNGNYEKAIEFGEKAYAIDSTNLFYTYLLGCHHMFLGHNEESLRYLKIYEKKLKTLDRPDPNRTYRIGQAYWINGFEKEAEQYFTTGLEQLNKMTELSRYDLHQEIYTYYSIAAIYAIRGDKDKAYENLGRVHQRQRIALWLVSLIKIDPSFDNIRGEPNFQQIVKNMEVKYQAEHERVSVWLEKERML